MAFGLTDDRADRDASRVVDRRPRVTFGKADAVADLGCRADDDARSVIDAEESFADGRPVDVDAGLAVCVFRHHPWDERHAEVMQHVCQAIDGHGAQAGVAEDDLVEAFRRRIAVERGLDILRERPAQTGDLFQKTNRDSVGFCQRVGAILAGFAVIAKSARDLLGQAIMQRIDQAADVFGDI